MQRLHFKEIIKDFNKNIDESVLEGLKVWLKENETDCSEKVNSLVELYENYFQNTMTSEHRKTEKFWMINIYYINTYLVLHNVIDFIYLLMLFFSYGIWMFLYAFKFLKLKCENLNITEMLRNGEFIANRTGYSAGIVGFDMSLEQTINAEEKIV